MNQKSLWVAASIIALVIIGGFVFSVPHTRDVGKVTVEETPALPPVVSLHDVFKKGTHTITGTLEVPNACTNVSAQATSTAATILVALTLSDTGGVCLQLPTTLHFQTSISADAHIPITATVNGSVASTTPV